MSALVIPNLEEAIYVGLQERAAAHGRSLEEEAIEVLRTVLPRNPGSPPFDLAARIRERFAPFGGVDLDIARRTEPLPSAGAPG